MNQGDNDGGRVAGSFTFQAQLPNGKSLSFSQYVLAGQTETELNRHLDVAAAVIERQRLLSEIPTLEAKLDNWAKSKRQVQAMLEDLHAKERQTSSDKQQIQTMTINLKNIEDEMRQGEKAIEEARRSLAM